MRRRMRTRCEGGATSRPLPAGLNTTRFQHFLIQHFFFQHYLISTLLHSTPIVFNTTLIQQAPIQHTLHSTHLVFNTFLYSTLLDFNNHGFNTTCFQHLWFQHSLFSTILVFNTTWIQHFFFSYQDEEKKLKLNLKVPRVGFCVH